MKQVTIFTPTYNRAYILHQLYESLCRQTCKDFVWLIVDDGSTDHTEEIVDGWIKEELIQISYHKQDNKGKMSAHNYGVKLCTTPLFACVDSDDYLTDTAISHILVFWEKNYHDETDVCGMVAYRYMITSEEGAPQIFSRFPKQKYGTLFSLTREHRFCGETIIVFKTEIIRHYPFPIIAPEKFITEAVVYEQLDAKYKLLLCDEAFVFCKFYEDGYTKNGGTLYKRYPMGWAYYFNQQCLLWKDVFTLKERLRALVYYRVFSKLAGIADIYRKSNDKSLLYVIAMILTPYYKRKIINAF